MASLVSRLLEGDAGIPPNLMEPPSPGGAETGCADPGAFPNTRGLNHEFNMY